MLAIFSPAGFEQFFSDFTEADLKDTEAYVAKATALEAKYALEVVGPPLDIRGEPMIPPPSEPEAEKP